MYGCLIHGTGMFPGSFMRDPMCDEIGMSWHIHVHTLWMAEAANKFMSG